MKNEELERLLKIGIPIGAFLALWGLILFPLVYIRDLKLENNSNIFILFLMEAICFALFIFFVEYMRRRWGWLRKK